ncbi:MAG TPA: SPOR domain-containing protein [Longimicrobium sp.]|nr:SPOR domain-containing protein [Longimicrobium sp.]
MTDPHTAADSAGLAFPAPTFFDPAFERLPAAAGFDPGRPGPLLVLFDRTADRDWVADAAIAIATGWNATGQRTVLADLSLDDPMLAERIGMSSMEGVVDIFLYGASLARSARPVPGRGFYLISAGTYTPDATSVLRNPRWEKIVAGFREAGASLLLFVPADAEGLPALLRWTRDAIVLGNGDGAAPALAATDGMVLHALLTPPAEPDRAVVAPRAAAAAPAVAAPLFPEPDATPGLRPWLAPPREVEPGTHEEFRSAGETVGAPAATLPVPDREWDEKPAAVRTRRSPLLPILLALLAVALLAYFVLQRFPEILGGTPAAPAAEAPAAPAAAVPAAGARGGVAGAGTALPYAVWVAAFEDLKPARAKADEVGKSFAEARFYVTPELTGDKLYYKVFAGTLADSAAAASLRARLMEKKLINADAVGTEDDLILVRPLALEIGEFNSREGAQTRADMLGMRRIPTYVVPVPFADGSERWRVYGGAFGDSVAARPMIKMLQDARVPARLVERTGRAPAAPK